MPSEILSTARPSRLRVAGFLCVAAGAVAMGVGATREWAAIGFPADAKHALDASWNGIDVWEGKVLLLAAAMALFALLAMRLTTRPSTRRALAVLIIVLGLAGMTLPLLAAARADERFGGAEGIDRLAEHIATASGQPEDVVLKQLEEQFARALRVDLGPGLWLTAAGGLLLVVGGVLGLAWIRQRDAAAGQASPETPASPEGDSRD
jgi:hypothetical protein